MAEENNQNEGTTGTLGFTSIFCDQKEAGRPMWSESPYKLTSQIPEPILKQGPLYKVKSGFRKDPKHFILTKKAIYYTEVEQSDEIKGFMEINWLLVEFIDPANPVENIQRDNSSYEIVLDSKPSCDFGNELRSDISPASELKSKFYSSVDNISNNIMRSPFLNQKKVLNAGTLHFEENGTYNRGYLRTMLRKINPNKKLNIKKPKGLIGMPESSKDPNTAKTLDFHSQLRFLLQQSKPFYIIRFYKGNKYTELGTFVLPHFVDWMGSLKFLCISARFSVDYKILDPVGEGRHCKLYTATRRSTQAKFIAKSINKKSFEMNPSFLHSVKNEISILRECMFSRIIQLYEVYEDELCVILILDHIVGPSIQKSCEMDLGIREADLICFFKDSVDTLNYLHSKDILHRNISCKSLILKDIGKPSAKNKPILISFNDACKFDDVKSLAKRAGTLGYIAPEILNTYDVMHTDFFKADIFALGCVLFTMMAGHELFPHTTDRELYLANKNYKPQVIGQRFITYNAELRQMVISMVSKNPGDRPTTQTLLASKIFVESRSSSPQTNPKENKSPKRFLSLLDRFTGNLEIEIPHKKEENAPEAGDDVVAQERRKRRNPNVKPVNPFSSAGQELMTKLKTKSFGLKKYVTDAEPHLSDGKETKLGSKSMGLDEKEPQSPNSPTKKRVSTMESIAALSDTSESVNINRPRSLSIHRPNLEIVNRYSHDKAMNDTTKITERFAVKENPFDRKILRVRIPKVPQKMRDLSGTFSLTSDN